MVLIDKLTAIANAIRAKTGKTQKLTLDEMVQEIREFGGILVNVTFEITTRTASGEIPVYTSELLKNLSQYVVLVYEAIPQTTFRTIANLGLKTSGKEYDRIRIAANTTGSLWGNGTSNTPMIDENGTVKIEPYASDYAVQINTYRLIVIGE